jgi:F420-dependent oxidoreductase-like protein
VKFGISFGPQRCTWEQLLDVTVRADRLGYDTLWPFDHIIPLSPDLEDPILECWSMLGAFAQATERIRIGQLVTANTLRHPALLAKMAATLDHVSGGRLIVGIGTGYWEPEHELYGIPLPGLRERGEMLAEACHILRGMWRERRFSFDGKHYRLQDAPAEPKPVQPGGPPILVGGRGRNVTLRTVARHADMWNMPPGTDGIVPDQWRELYEVLLRRCEEIGRDPAEIETNVALIAFVNEDGEEARGRRRRLAEAFGMDEATALPHCVCGTPDEVVEQVDAFRERGVEHFVLGLVPGHNFGEDLELFAERVMPELR